MFEKCPTKLSHLWKCWGHHSNVFRNPQTSNKHYINIFVQLLRVKELSGFKNRSNGWFGSMYLHNYALSYLNTLLNFDRMHVCYNTASIVGRSKTTFVNGCKFDNQLQL